MTDKANPVTALDRLNDIERQQEQAFLELPGQLAIDDVLDADHGGEVPRHGGCCDGPAVPPGTPD